MRIETFTKALIALGTLCIGSATAQNFPLKPIRMLAPEAGGGVDFVARMIAREMSASFGQQVVIDNRGGAGGTLGMGRVAKTVPDGYTIAVWHIAHATAPALYENLKYNPLDDFDHIGRITDVPMTLVSKTALPTKTVGEIIQWMKTQNAKATYGHAGTGSASHLCALLLMNRLGIQMTGVPFRGTGPAMNDLIGGQFDVMCDQTTGTTNQIKDGKIKGYAVTTLTKVSSLPDLPTLDQSGMKGFEVSAWHAMWAPKGLPKEATDKLVSALQAALKDPKVVDRFASLGTEPVAPELATPTALRSQLASELTKWQTVIKSAGVKGE